ncbi:DNA-directed RNA polymerase III subunit rpc6-like [Olea europaea var. sylvestris]|uniref:DNA-directed RNA polymerase III subunit rpc6-like n=1 Tax=Olea europaea var. sylvestris TaxID=158386 RepID=UPI000C1D3D4B|nr:DNA-directed RNA polymerase III subunit rpc6-like [Olea europaea var. sylvestris]XP_022867692.1 DNA-directed RNA polymerase III subunit rpc6-like [Olea europaea var. sylvestris]
MADEFEPSKQVSGGLWYVDGNLDKELVNVMKQLCLRCIRIEKVATLERVHEHLKKQQVVNFEISSQQVFEIFYSMVLDNEIIEVKSTGLWEYYSIPIGTVCYRFDSGPVVAKGSKVGAFASIPCGACTRINPCTPNGVISPSNCAYSTKWLNIDF